MGINVRINEKELQELHKHVSAQGLSISEFVRTAITEKLERDRVSGIRKTPYEALMELNVDFDSGKTNRSLRHREIFNREIEQRHR